MKYGASAAAVAIVLLLTGQAKAITGNELLDWCTSEEAWKQGACLGYISGLEDVLVTCIPPGVTPKQLKAIVMGGLNIRPAILHSEAGPIAARAIGKAFNCLDNEEYAKLFEIYIKPAFEKHFGREGE